MIENLKYAAYNRETVTISGGLFSPDEIERHVACYEGMRKALREIARYSDRAVIENDAGDTLRYMARVALANLKP